MRDEGGVEKESMSKEDRGVEVMVGQASLEEKEILRNLMELYLYDFSEMTLDDVDEAGLYRDEHLDKYWIEPGRFPFLIRADGKLAGFALVRQGSHFARDGAAEQPAGMTIAEFFVLRKYRKKGIGEKAAAWIFDRFPGRWEVAEMPENSAALAFWRKAIGQYTGGNYQEFFLETELWHGPVQVFECKEE